jgi:hypothetical protein
MHRRYMTLALYPKVVGILRAGCWWWSPHVRKCRPGRGCYGGSLESGALMRHIEGFVSDACPWQPLAWLWSRREYHMVDDTMMAYMHA